MASDEFRSFVKERPNLAKFVENGEMTWQKFYELFDLYGKDSEVWDKYIDTGRANVANGIDKIGALVKNIDTDSIKSHISTAQKAIDFFGDLTKKDAEANTFSAIGKGPVAPRPLNKFFED